jgi:hypothetical protein
MPISRREWMLAAKIRKYQFKGKAAPPTHDDSAIWAAVVAA